MLYPPYSTQNVPPGASNIGPIDRESFFTAQRRYRRQTWRLATYCFLAVFLAGIPVSATLTPVVLGLVLLVSGVINVFWPLPPVIPQTYHDVGFAFFQAISWLSKSPGSPAPSQTTLLIDVALLILPGAMAMLFLWTLVQAIFARAGVGGILWRLGARPPRMDDFKERQLVDIVAEMVLAAGIQQPRVAILDAGDPNAAFIGTCEEDAVVVVSRQLLDRHSRDEVQGVIAHVIAAIGNGDLKIAFHVVAVKLTQALARTLVTATFSADSRSVIKSLLRLAFRRRGTTRFAAEAEQVIQRLLLESSSSDSGKDTGCGAVLSLPLEITYMNVLITTFMMDMFVIAPPICRMWRTRRLLADASAVQLTRNPDGLARALQSIEGSVPGGELAAHLFVTWPSGGRGERIWPGVHPRLESRLRRFQKLGSSIVFEKERYRPQGKGKILLYLSMPFLLVLFFVLIALMLYVSAIMIVLTMLLELGFMSALLAGMYELFFVALPLLHHLL